MGVVEEQEILEAESSKVLENHEFGPNIRIGSYKYVECRSFRFEERRWSLPDDRVIRATTL